MLKLRVRKLIKEVADWKVYANYIGESIKEVELLNGDTTYFLENIGDIDGVMESMPGDIEQTIRALFR